MNKIMEDIMVATSMKMVDGSHKGGVLEAHPYAFPVSEPGNLYVLIGKISPALNGWFPSKLSLILAYFLTFFGWLFVCIYYKIHFF